MFCSRCWMISKLFLESITSFSLCLLASLTAALILRTWNVLLWNILLFIQKLILRTSAAAKAFTSFTISPTSTFLCYVLSDIWAVKKTPRIHPMSQQKSKWQKQRLSRRANNYALSARESCAGIRASFTNDARVKCAWIRVIYLRPNTGPSVKWRLQNEQGRKSIGSRGEIFERKSISINFNSLFIRKIKVRGIGARMEGLERRQEEIVRLLNSLRLFRNRQNWPRKANNICRSELAGISSGMARRDSLILGGNGIQQLQGFRLINQNVCPHNKDNSWYTCF